MNVKSQSELDIGIAISKGHGIGGRETCLLKFQGRDVIRFRTT